MPARARKVRLTGKLIARWGDDGVLVSAKIRPHGECADYNILLDDRGVQLAEEMHERDVSVAGTLVDELWDIVKVKKFRPVRDKRAETSTGDMVR